MTRGAVQRATFKVMLHRSIWRVTLDDEFFGDYRSKQNALDGLYDKTIALQNAGAVVSVVAPQDDTR